MIRACPSILRAVVAPGILTIRVYHWWLSYFFEARLLLCGESFHVACRPEICVWKVVHVSETFVSPFICPCIIFVAADEIMGHVKVVTDLVCNYLNKDRNMKWTINWYYSYFLYSFCKFN